MDEKKLLCIKTRFGADLLGAQISLDNKPLEVCALAKQEYRNGWIWQWWIIMPSNSKRV